MIYYVSETYVNPTGLAFALLMGVLLIVLPRRYAVVPIILLMCYMTMGTRIVVGGLTFTMLRILLLFGWARLLIRQELHGLKLNRIDKVIIAFVISSVVTYTLLWQNYDAFKNKMGLAYNVIGFFFLFRFLIRTLDDAIRLIRIAAVVVVPLAVVMVLEKVSGHNMFATLGGVPEISAVRDGVTRCQGPFSHPILAGSFGATMLPMFLGLWTQKDKAAKIIASLGILAAATIVICAGSSGPLLAGLAGIGGFFMWPLRRNMRMVRWGIVAAIIILQMGMKPPFWFVIAKIDIFSGNTGWHRAHLIDTAYRNFFDWWLVGTQSNANWDSYDHNFDITNQYVNYGIDGGVITLALFVTIIIRCFAGVGGMVRNLRIQSRANQVFAWSMGGSLFAHTVNYFSISYFDQNLIAWFMLLAMISSISSYAIEQRRAVLVPAEQGAAPALEYA